MFDFGPPWPLVGISKYAGDTRGEFYDIAEIPWYYPPLGYSEEGFKVSMAQPMVPNQDTPIVLSPKVLG